MSFRVRAHPVYARWALLDRTEGAIALLALLAMVFALLGRGLTRTALPLVRFFSVYTVLPR